MKILGFSGGSCGKEPSCNAGDPGSTPGLGKSQGEGNGNSLQCTCPGEFHGQRSLMGYSPWGHKESDVTERITLTLLGGSDGKESACNAGDLGLVSELKRCPEEGNGYPLQYACLENPIDRGAWWVTVHGVTKSWTRPKLLSIQALLYNHK